MPSLVPSRDPKMSFGENLIQRLETAVSRLEAMTESNTPKPSSSNPVPVSSPPLGDLRLSLRSIACSIPELAVTAAPFDAAAAQIESLILSAPKSAAPHSPAASLAPITTALKSIIPDNRSEFFPHMKAMEEAAGFAAALFAGAHGPAHADGVLEALDFNLNKVLRRKIQAETEWAKGLKALVKAWKDSLGKDGLVWACEVSSPALAAPVATCSVPSAGQAGVFAEISRGLNLTRVTDDMKTKNRPAGDAVPIARQPVASPPKKICTGPPVCEIRRDNWHISGWSGQKVDLCERGCEVTMKQLVYVGGCVDSQIVVGIDSGKAVNGFPATLKAKSITVDSCTRCTIIVGSVISSVELVNCEKVKLQVLGCVPTICIDKCNGVGIWLSAASESVAITTAKSSEMNMSIERNGEWAEMPIPEQFTHRLVNGKVASSVSDLYF